MVVCNYTWTLEINVHKYIKSLFRPEKYQTYSPPPYTHLHTSWYICHCWRTNIVGLQKQYCQFQDYSYHQLGCKQHNIASLHHTKKAEAVFMYLHSLFSLNGYIDIIILAKCIYFQHHTKSALFSLFGCPIIIVPI